MIACIILVGYLFTRPVFSWSGSDGIMGDEVVLKYQKVLIGIPKTNVSDFGW